MGGIALPLVVLAALYALWRTFYRYLTTYDLDNLPGPTLSSFWLGMFFLVCLFPVMRRGSIDYDIVSQEIRVSSAIARAGSVLPLSPTHMALSRSFEVSWA